MNKLEEKIIYEMCYSDMSKQEIKKRNYSKDDLSIINCLPFKIFFNKGE